MLALAESGEKLEQSMDIKEVRDKEEEIRVKSFLRRINYSGKRMEVEKTKCKERIQISSREKEASEFLIIIE